MMKLYIFHHCPFCVKALMAAGYKHLNVEKVYMLNHDVNARIEKVGANMVPILKKDDGTFMGESLDIVAYLDNLDGKPSVAPGEHQEQIQTWLKANMPNISPLLYPRWLKFRLPEVATEEAAEWFTANKTKQINMSFDQAFARSEEFAAKVSLALAELTWVTLPSDRQNVLTYDDINLYPFLRSLTAVKAIQFPPIIRRYITEVTDLTGVPVYFDQAI